MWQAMQTGVCAGYEIYGAGCEIYDALVAGDVRTDYLLHHISCLAFTAVTYVGYTTVIMAKSEL